AEALAPLTTEGALARLDAAGIACARLNSVAQLADHPQLTARDRWREVESPVGPLRTLLPPIVFPDAPEPRMDRIPALGQDTDEVLAGLGLREAEVKELRDAGVVA
ncbi:CoA transferase, partial [Streptomyces sp. SID2131]|nr:CoA transferase [Streptomyces sp. SID2131]